MDKTFVVSIKNKRAKNLSSFAYVCNNNDYSVLFEFDDEWDEYETKTARFIEADGSSHDKVFSGNECDFPEINDTYRVEIGVFAGDIKTSTAAVVTCERSILSKKGPPADPPPDVYAQIMARLNELENGEITPEQIAQAVEDYLRENPVGGVDPDELTQAVEAALQAAKDSGEFDGAAGKSAYQYAQEGGYKGTEAEFAAKLAKEIPDPYTLPTASADVKGGVKVGNGLRMDGEVLGIVPEQEYELIDSVIVAEGDEIKGFACTKRLKDFELTFEVPAASESVTGGVEIYKRNREFAAYVYMAQIIHTSNVLCVVKSVVVNRKHLVDQLYNQWSSESSKAQTKTAYSTVLMTDANEPFTLISLYSSAPFPAGTKFVLRGVLADA